MDDRHHCDYPACDKSFRRLEHLRRHKLNHTNSTINCPHCDRIFYRNDLLQRHINLKHRKGQRQRTPSLSAGGLAVHAHRQDPLGSVASRPSSNSDGASRHDLMQDPQDTRFLQNEPLGGSDLSELPPTTSQALLQGSGSLSVYNVDPFGQSLEWMYYTSPSQGLNGPQQLLPGGHQSWSQAASDPSIVDQPPIDDFYISLQTHNGLMSVVAESGGRLALTTQDSLRVLEHAFRYLVDSLPIFHRPTFNLESIRTELRSSIFCIGLLISGDVESHRVGCALLQKLQGDLLQFARGNAIKMEEIWALQAMLLLEFAGMFLADRNAMELSDIFHGTLVTLARRLELFSPPYEPTNLPGKSIRDDWVEWVQRESAKRLAYFIFVTDLLHVLFFGHSRTIFSAFSVKLDLPCEDTEWQAAGAPEWRSIKSSLNSPALKFHKIHQVLLAPSPPLEKLPAFSALSGFLLLCGLATIAADLRRRDEDPLIDSQGALQKAGSVLPLVFEFLPSFVTDSTNVMLSSAKTVYYISMISLRTPLDDLEYATNSGFSRAGVTPRQHARDAMVRLLTRHRVSDHSARHAIRLLQVFLPPLSNPASPYETSALYIGTLTLWAYTIGENHDTESMAMTEAFSESQVLIDFEDSIRTKDMDASRRHWRVLVGYAAKRLGERHDNNAREYSEVLRSLEDSTV